MALRTGFSSTQAYCCSSLQLQLVPTQGKLCGRLPWKTRTILLNVVLFMGATWCSDYLTNPADVWNMVDARILCYRRKMNQTGSLCHHYHPHYVIVTLVNQHENMFQLFHDPLRSGPLMALVWVLFCISDEVILYEKTSPRLPEVWGMLFIVFWGM